jgi:DNA-binding NtrC family response regulator
MTSPYVALRFFVVGLDRTSHTQQVTEPVLLVDDDRDLLELLKAQLEVAGLASIAVTTAQEALLVLEQRPVSAVVTDVQMPGVSGTDLCARIVKSFPDVPVLVMTVKSTLDVAVDAIRAGAHDFITKPIRAEELVLQLQRAMQLRELRGEVRRLRRSISETRKMGSMVGASAAMQKVYRLVEQVAGSEASVLITGESGTGKELVARALHDLSKRSAGPFVAVNCAALTESLLESQLFGHQRGAFTGASAAHAGLLVEAQGGTLFLDEVGEMTAGMQAKLLRALQERTVRPIGGTAEVRFDARIVAATNRDLEASALAGTFRRDLLFRLDVVRVELPPLRERSGDILLLAQHFLEQFAARAGKGVKGLSPDVALKLLGYPWPGNARELQNCMERAVAVAFYDQIVLGDLPDRVTSSKPLPDAEPMPRVIVKLAEVEKRHVLHVLDAVGGNKTLAARALGIGRKTLYRKLGEFSSSSSPSPSHEEN